MNRRFSTNKYNVSPSAERQFNGRTYGSKAEMHYAQMLELLKQNGDIVEYIEQPKFKLGVPENVYVADFLVIERYCDKWDPDCPCAYVVDVKGMQTAKFKRDMKLWAAYGRLPLRIAEAVGNKFREDTIMPRRAAA